MSAVRLVTPDPTPTAAGTRPSRCASHP